MTREEFGETLQRVLLEGEFRELVLLAQGILSGIISPNSERKDRLEVMGRKLIEEARSVLAPRWRPRGSGQGQLVDTWWEHASFAVEALLDIAWRRFPNRPQWPYVDGSSRPPKEQTVSEFHRRLEQLESEYEGPEPDLRPPRELLWLYDTCIVINPEFAPHSRRPPRELPEDPVLPRPRRSPKIPILQPTLRLSHWAWLVAGVFLATVAAEMAYVYGYRWQQLNSLLEKVQVLS